MPEGERRHLRVLHIVSGKLYGGVETMLVALARYRCSCPEMKPEFALCFDGRINDELCAAGVPVHQLGEVRIRYPLSVARARRKLRELLATRQIDVVVTHLPWAHVVFGPAAIRAQVPLVLWLHDAPSRGHLLDRLAARVQPRMTICNSRYTATGAAKVFAGVPTEVVFYPVMPASSALRKDRAEVRRELT